MLSAPQWAKYAHRLLSTAYAYCSLPSGFLGSQVELLLGCGKQPAIHDVGDSGDAIAFVGDR